MSHSFRRPVVSAFAASQSELLWQMWCMLVKYSCATGSPTIEWELSFHCVHSPWVLCHTLIRAGILLLKIWDFQDTAGFPHVHFPGEGYTVHSPPGYRRYWAVTTGKCNTAFNFCQCTTSAEKYSYMPFSVYCGWTINQNMTAIVIWPCAMSKLQELQFFW